MIPEWELVLRIILSCICGGLIGFQREKCERPAGFRTHTLVCMGSCVIMILSAYSFYDLTGTKDPARLSAAVISGIGFLGAGTIWKDGVTVQGLTTAACLWVVSAIGLAVGIGSYLIAIITTAIVYIVLSGICEKIIFKRHKDVLERHNRMKKSLCEDK